MPNLNTSTFNSDETGIEGVVDKVIQTGREWRIKTQGRYWSARSREPANLQLGDLVRIIGRRNLTLIVEPIQEVS